MIAAKHLLSWTAIAFFAASLTQSALAEVGAVYLKNNGQYAAHVWVDGKYQGRVPAGDTRYAVRDGFVTGDGGSVGGWDAKGDVQVVVASTDDKGNNWYAEVNLPEDSKDDGRVWFGGPLALSDTDKENAGKIIISGNGNGPTGMLQDAKKAADDKRDDKATTTSTDNASTKKETKTAWSPMTIQLGKGGGLKKFVGTWFYDGGQFHPELNARIVKIDENGTYAHCEPSLEHAGFKITWLVKNFGGRSSGDDNRSLEEIRRGAAAVDPESYTYRFKDDTTLVWLRDDGSEMEELHRTTDEHIQEMFPSYKSK